MRFFHGALLGYNNLQMHSYIQYSCGSVSKIRSPLLQMGSLTRCLGDCIFPVPEEVACSFLNISFDIFWTKYKFGLCIKTWRRGCGCLQLSFYLSKRVSLCSRQGFFATLLLISSHFVLSRIELPKLTSSILIEISTILVVWLINSIFTCTISP